LPYERDDHLDLYPIEYRIGLAALEDARYIKVEMGRDFFSTTNFRTVELDGDYYVECEEPAQEPSDVDPATPTEPRHECKRYPVASQDIRCARDAARKMVPLPEGVQGDALLLAIMAVESHSRGPANRDVEFLVSDAAGLVGWEPDLSLGRAQIRLSTAT